VLEDRGAFYTPCSPRPPRFRSVHRSPSSSSLEDSAINDIALDPAASSSAPLTRFLSSPGELLPQ
jgi:hypothetical protein